MKVLRREEIERSWPDRIFSQIYWGSRLFFLYFDFLLGKLPDFEAQVSNQACCDQDEDSYNDDPEENHIQPIFLLGQVYGVSNLHL